MTKEKQTPKAKPVYKTLTVKYDQKARTYSVYDESGKEYTAEDRPREIMMKLAHEKGQILYFVDKKWRRMKPEVSGTTTPVPAKESKAKTVKTENVTEIIIEDEE